MHVADDVALEAADYFLLGASFGGAPRHVGPSPVAVAKPDDHDHVQRPVGLAVPVNVESVPAGLAGRRWDRRYAAQVGERCLGTEPVDVLPGCGEQRCCVARADAELRDHRRCGDLDEPFELAIEISDLIGQRTNTLGHAPQRELRRPIRVDRC